MDFNQTKKRILPHLFTVVLFVIACSLYYMPEWQGKQIDAHDKISYQGAAKEAHEYRAKGDNILWTSRVFSGMPLVPISNIRDSNLIKKLESFRLLLPYSMRMSFALMLGFYIALLLLGIRVPIAASVSLVFGFSTWFLLSIEAVHSSKIFSVSYVAPMVASIIAAYRGRVLLGGIFTALFLSLLIGAAHPQIAFFSLLIVLVVVVVFCIDAVKNKQTLVFMKKSMVLLGFGVFSLFPNANYILPLLDFNKESTRGGQSELTTSEQAETTGLNYDYAMRWSYGKMESFNLLIPGLYAGGYTPGENSRVVEELSKRGVPGRQALEYAKGIPMYYGDQPFTSGPIYIGASLLFLFLLFLFLEKQRIKWALLATFVLSLFFAWGEHFDLWNRFFFEHLPMLNKFRNPSMWLSLAIIVVSMGGAMAMNILMQQHDAANKKIKQKAILNALKILGIIPLAFLLFGGMLVGGFSGAHDQQLAQAGFPVDAIIDDRIALMRRDALRSLIFILATAGLVWLWVSEKIKKSKVIYVAISAIFLLDLVPIGLRHFNADDFVRVPAGKKALISPTQADQFILQDDEVNFRVFNTTVSPFNDNTTSYFHQSVGGYSAAKLYRYQDLIDHHLAHRNMNAFNMLNTKYFIQGERGQEQAAQNSGALGSVWYVNQIQWAEDADAEMEAMKHFDPAREAIIDKRYQPGLTQDKFTASGAIELTSFHPDRMEYQSSSDQEQFAVFSEIWYKGNEAWKAYMNGEEVEFVRVNYLLRGMQVPAGKHKIVFEYKPRSHYLGVRISFISSLILLLFLVSVMFFRKYKRNNEHIRIQENS